MPNQTTKKNQKGAAVVVTAILLLIGVTLVVMFAAQVGLQDQRISGNQYRHKQAFANAEAGLDYAASYLRRNPTLHEGNAADGWTSCTGNTLIFPCNLNSADSVLGTISGGIVTSSIPTLTGLNSFMVKAGDDTVIVGLGTSDDGTAESVIQASYGVKNLIVPGELPPLMMPSGDLSGNFNIVPNPDGGGPGIPVSVWATTDLDTSGSNWKTCDHDQFRDGSDVCMDTKGDGSSGSLGWTSCACDDERSNSTNVNSDIVMYASADFPTSPFVYVFGDPDVDSYADLKPEIKSIAETEGLLLEDCTDIDLKFNALSGSALVWVEGDCKINSGSLSTGNIGSRSKPIVLVIEGDIQINSNIEIWGIFVGLAGFSLQGGPVIHGSAISEFESDLTNGAYSQVYDKDVFDNLIDPDINSVLSRIQYSWRDF